MESHHKYIQAAHLLRFCLEHTIEPTLYLLWAWLPFSSYLLLLLGILLLIGRKTASNRNGVDVAVHVPLDA